MGYAIKIWMSGEYSELESDKMYNDILAIGADVLISDFCESVDKFNKSQK